MPGTPDSTEGPGESEFLRLFVGHESALRAFARVLLPDWEAVDEVMQESSVVMWRKLDQLEEPDGFLPWAKVIVRYEALRFRRGLARDRHLFGEDVLERLAEEADPAEDREAERERKALRRCLAKLDPRQRSLVLLPYAKPGAVTRLAEASRRSVNSLYKQIGRLREKLQACIERELTRA